MSLIISVSGLRGVVGQTLTPEVVARYVGAFAAELPPGKVLVSFDGRATGPEFARVAAQTLAAAGHHVLDAGPCATPTTGVLVRAHGCVAGVQISASHNPAEYNGIKLFGDDGRVVPADRGQRVKTRYLAGETALVTTELPAAVEQLADTTSAHWQRIAEVVDAPTIRAKGFAVLLDSNHGAGGIAGRRVLDELGCHTLHLGETPDGAFAHLPEPTEENLRDVAAQVADVSVAVGFCQDPDADRLALIDEQGRYVGEEYTLALCVDHVLRRAAGPVVTNCSTSRMTEDLAIKYGVPMHRTAVGEANVVDKMLDCGAVIGGEGNGGVIHPRVVGVRDSMVGMALILEAMATRDLPLSKLVDELPRYAMHKSKVTLPSDQVAAALDRLERHFPDARPDRLDGLRLDWSDRWLLVRTSNTEPIVRIFSEAPTADEARDLCSQAAAAMQFAT